MQPQRGRKKVADQLAIAFAFINLGYRQSLHQMKLSLALHDFYQCWWNPCACAKRQTLSKTFCMQVYQ
jgi:hypothetical protein